MPEFFVNKTRTDSGTALVPHRQSDLDAMKSLSADKPLRVKVSVMRNYDFFKKWWALIDLAFDYWEPPENFVGEKNKDRFRKDIIILAGFYERVVRLDGSTRIEPKSISFGKMSEDEFSDLYNKTIDVIVNHVLTHYTGDELRSIVEQVEAFD